MSRPWRAAGIALGMLGLVLVVTWFIYRRTVTYEAPPGSVSGAVTSVQAGPGAPPALTYGGASLTWAGGIAVLRVTGDAHAIGAAHGRLLAPHLRAAVRATNPSIESTVTHGGMFSELTRNMRLAWRWRFVDDGLIDQDRRMVAGIVRGASASGVELSFEQLVRAQAVLDVGAPSPRSGEVEHKNLALSLTVVAPQAQAPARVWVGRTFALPGLDDGGDFALPVVTIARPEGRVAWAGIGWPGEVGVVSGVNANGIAVFVEPARTSDVHATRVARPVALLARTVLEQAKTLDEAIKLFETTPTLGTAVIAIVDGSSGKWVQVERTPSKAIVERAPKAPAVGNVLTTNALSDDPDNDRARRFLPVMQRVERATRLVRTPLTDAAAMAAILRDQRSLDDVVRPSGHRGVIDDG
ncbi:MAG: C45 family autoproteolytic acyltransferase/hydrolase, partial [Kofleriaceae bacterium]